MFFYATAISVNDITSDTCQASIDSLAIALFFLFFLIVLLHWQTSGSRA